MVPHLRGQGTLKLDRNSRVPNSSLTLDEIRVYLAGAPFTNWSESAEAFAASDALAAADRKYYLRALLYPARFVASRDCRSRSWAPRARPTASQAPGRP